MSTRQVDVARVSDAVEELFLRANTVLRKDVTKALKDLYEKEQKPLPKKMLGVLLENRDIAEKKNIPICQDTGVAVVFLKVGRSVAFTGGELMDAVDAGVRRAYEKGGLRKSVVEDPVLRGNTGTNTPAFVHAEIVPGDKIGITAMPKGFGSENKSVLCMLDPTSGEDAITDLCVESVRSTGPDACPPYVLGVGIGATADLCCLLAKKALLRDVDSSNPAQHLGRLEQAIKEEVNRLGIGVMGLGGISTVMGVNIEAAPTHIAGLPVAINLSCHALRSADMVI
ncbi:MAG: fumarate hydratase [Candidatus Omnitrophica bacterium]|nr:fumarate hydratase [Candidatus Omnitrophota bacterium]